MTDTKQQQVSDWAFQQTVKLEGLGRAHLLGLGRRSGTTWCQNKRPRFYAQSARVELRRRPGLSSPGLKARIIRM